MRSRYGSSRPKVDILNLIEMYKEGKLLLDELLRRTYPLDRINEAYAAPGTGRSGAQSGAGVKRGGSQMQVSPR